MWKHGIKEQVLHSVHRYDSLPYERQVVPKGKGAALPKKLYMPMPTDASADFKSIVGTSAPSWFTCNSATSPMPYCDGVLLRYCAASDRMAELHNSWLCVFFRGGQQLIQHRDSQEWLFILGELNGLLGSAWPAERIGQDFAPKMPLTLQELRFVACLDIDEWKSMSYTWVSPLDSHRKAPKRGARLAQLLARPTSKPKSLFVTAAEHCFFDLGLLPLRHIAKFVGCDVPPGAKLYALVKRLVQFALPDIDEPKLVEILMLRCKEEHLTELTLDPEDVEALLDKSDKQEYDKLHQQQQAHLDEIADFRADLQDFKKRVWSAGGSKPKHVQKATAALKKKHIPYKVPPRRTSQLRRPTP